MTRRGNAVIQFHVAWEEAMRLNQHVTLTCAFCDFHTQGELYFARREHQQHRAKHHPEAVPSRRRKGRAPTMVGSKPITEIIANARKQGASTWEGATT